MAEIDKRKRYSLDEVASRLRQLASIVEQGIYVHNFEVRLEADFVCTGDNGNAHTFAVTGKRRAALSIEWDAPVPDKS